MLPQKRAAWPLQAHTAKDKDGDHTITADEFTERCVQLHGPARSVDLYSMKLSQERGSTWGVFGLWGVFFWVLWDCVFFHIEVPTLDLGFRRGRPRVGPSLA